MQSLICFHFFSSWCLLLIFNQSLFVLQRRRRALRKKGGKGKDKGDKGKPEEKGDKGGNLIVSICKTIDHINITVSLILFITKEDSVDI